MAEIRTRHLFTLRLRVSGMQAIGATPIGDRRIGLVDTMIFAHVPSNVLLILVPLMPDVYWAVGVLLARFSISQMDVPTRQAYTMVLVAPEERAAAAGVTNAVRPIAASAAPAISGLALQAAASGLPFILAGALKVVYDVLIWITFRRIRPSG